MKNVDVLVMGGIVLDRYITVEHYPEEGQCSDISESFYRVCGTSINMALAIKGLGGKPYIVSNIGRDAGGKKILKYMEINKLPQNCIREVDEVTGERFTIMEGDRAHTALVSKGCEANFDRGLLPGYIINKADAAVVIGNYLMNQSAKDIIEIIREQKYRGFKVLFDPNQMAEKIKPDILKEIIDLSDAITLDISEAECLAKDNEAFNWAKNISRGERAVIVRIGTMGGTVYYDTKSFSYNGIKTGDVNNSDISDRFAGALTYSLAMGMDLREGIKLASACGAKFVEENFSGKRFAAELTV